MKVELGQKAKDTITGFWGVVTGRAEYISGCHQALLAPPVKADGDFVESHWFDEDRLAVLPGPAVSLVVKDPGCDKPAPRR